MSLRSLLFVAASPLCLMAGVAHAETAISTSVSTPIATATAASGKPDDVHITASGTIKPTAPGAAVTLNSNNTVTNDGVLAFTDVDHAVGIAVQGGFTGAVNNTGTIQLTESYTPTDTNGDGLVDGPFAKGTGRFGIQVTGPAAFNGPINLSAGAITIQGNDSAGVSIETGLNGALTSAATMTITGDRSYGLHATGPITGNVLVTGAISASGAGATGVALDGPVTGRVTIDQSIITTGYRSTSRPLDSVIAKMTPDEMQISGSAVRISGDVTGGVLIAAPPAATSTTNTDVNNDGIPDATEATGALQVFGSAPALLIGGTSGSIHLGAAATGDDAYGLVIRGSVVGAGVYDGISATGVQIGGLGGNVLLDGGVRVTGSVTATTSQADATGMRLGAGTTAATISNAGSISASTSSTKTVNVRALEIDAGASSSVLFNSGIIAAAELGNNGKVTAVQDNGGQLVSITNTNTISATISPTDGSAAVGSRIALDLRANTTGVTVTQSTVAASGVTPSMVGDVLFGTGRGELDLLGGVMVGSAAFGGPTNALTIDNGASLTGGLTLSGTGTIAINVPNGSLTVTSPQALSVSTLNVGPTSHLVMTLDPQTGTNTRFNVAGAAVIGNGATIGIRLASKLDTPETFTLIKAGSLTTGTIDSTTLGSIPFLEKAALRVDAPNHAVLVDVRRSTAAEMGLTAGETQGLEAVYGNFDRDPAVRDAVLSKTDQAGFVGLYDQLLPDHSGGLFQALGAANIAAGRALDQGAGRLPADGYRAWTQEIGMYIQRDLDRDAKYNAAGFGLAGGIETPPTELGVLGLKTSFITAEVNEDARSSASSLNGSMFSAGLYWRGESGPLTLNLGGDLGYAWMGEKRAISDTVANLAKVSKSGWSGYTAAVHADAAWRVDMGSFFAKPEVTADYFLLKEDSRTEHGGGPAIDLAINERTSSQIDGFAGVVLGMRVGRDSSFTLTPEVTLGWTGVAGDGAGDTSGRFIAGGPNFSISTPKLSGGGGVLRAALRGQGQYFDFVVEGGGEFHDNYQAYDARISARWVF